MVYRYCRIKEDCYCTVKGAFDDGTDHKEDCDCRKNNRAETKCLPCDLPEYISPVTGRPVDGRSARREDLKRSGCREVDPTEYSPVYQNEKFMKKHGLTNEGKR